MTNDIDNYIEILIFDYSFIIHIFRKHLVNNNNTHCDNDNNNNANNNHIVDYRSHPILISLVSLEFIASMFIIHVFYDKVCKPKHQS